MSNRRERLLAALADHPDGICGQFLLEGDAREQMLQRKVLTRLAERGVIRITTRRGSDLTSALVQQVQPWTDVRNRNGRPGARLPR